ncbi:cysteine desulfurase-like protein [Pseudofrankia saprophytica]|uniref:cysteine desulfurase-like protein n=1 Tax=Pseudofrankia saprophytica TaxID=298655 RepID=UPI000234B66D|nr:cysteine desulfurase-like protein [Pseudofrankia saprophytica]
MTEPRAAPGVTTAYDVAAIRGHFPSLAAGAAHFDGPGGSQTPDVVAHAVYDTLTRPLANRGTVTLGERNAEEAVVACRAAVADLLGVEPNGVIFGRSMTQNTMDLARTIAKRWGPADEVVVTRLDHDSNVRPWVIAARAVGATVRFADFDPETGELAPDDIERVLSPSTRLVAVTAASNLIGTMPDIAAISQVVHSVGAWLHVDGVHHAAHAAVDVPALGADFYACSPYKFLGPHCGVTYGRPELLEQLSPDKLLPATDAVPERFELGTLPYELMAGTTAAVDFLAGLAPEAVAAGTGTDRRARLVASMAALQAHEDVLRERIEAGLRELPGATLWSRAARRTPTLLTTLEGHDPQSIRAFLGERGVNAPAGSFYAYEASHRLGLGDTGGLRVGLAPYNDDGDVDRLLSGLRDYFDR